MDRESVYRPASLLQGRLVWANIRALYREYCIDLIYRSYSYFSVFYSNILKQYSRYADLDLVEADGDVFQRARACGGVGVWRPVHPIGD